MLIERSNWRHGARATLTLVSALCLGSAVAVCAQTSDLSAARKDFALHCADCHGVDGKGNGPAVQMIPDFKPADLTRLSAQHGGQFPRHEVYDTIDGRDRLPGHYDPDTHMPLWGMTFQPAEGKFSGQSEEKVKARITGLVDYIEGIQQN